MNFATRCVPEPELEFGDSGRHVDPRYGLMTYGPLQPKPGDHVRIGVIGTTETVEGFAGYIDRAMIGIDGDNPHLGNLHPGFPGMGNSNPFRCRFEVPKEACRTVLTKDIKEIVGIRKHDEAVHKGVDLLINQARSLLESSARPEVIVVALPKPLLEKVVNASVASLDEVDDVDGDGQSAVELNFRDLFKAKALSLNVPTQIAWPSVWDDKFKMSHKLKGTDRRVQDAATRAWNLLNALFYKAGRAPWRLPKPEENGWATSYLGIGFYRDLDGHRLWTSTAQMFDERGKGLILRGARARTDRPGKHPYLAREDAYDLVKRSLDQYFLTHRQMPARLVILKTSRFEAGEAEGFAAAIEEMRVSMCDMLWVSEGAHTMLMREGDYPPLRGSFVELGKTGILYTRGSVPYYGTYPGARVPHPLHLRPHECETPLATLAEEVLALTKMNWNSTQFDQGLPIPIRAAREVGRVLRYVSYADRDQPDYRWYT